MDSIDASAMMDDGLHDRAVAQADKTLISKGFGAIGVIKSPPKGSVKFGEQVGPTMTQLQTDVRALFHNTKEITATLEQLDAAIATERQDRITITEWHTEKIKDIILGINARTGQLNGELKAMFELYHSMQQDIVSTKVTALEATIKNLQDQIDTLIKRPVSSPMSSYMHFPYSRHICRRIKRCLLFR